MYNFFLSCASKCNCGVKNEYKTVLQTEQPRVRLEISLSVLPPSCFYAEFLSPTSASSLIFVPSLPKRKKKKEKHFSRSLFKKFVTFRGKFPYDSGSRSTQYASNASKYLTDQSERKSFTELTDKRMPRTICSIEWTVASFSLHNR